MLSKRQKARVLCFHKKKHGVLCLQKSKEAEFCASKGQGARVLRKGKEPKSCGYACFLKSTIGNLRDFSGATTSFLQEYIRPFDNKKNKKSQLPGNLATYKNSWAPVWTAKALKGPYKSLIKASLGLIKAV